MAVSRINLTRILKLLKTAGLGLGMSCTTSVETNPGTLFTLKLDDGWLASCLPSEDGTHYYSLRYDFEFPSFTKQYFYYSNAECNDESWQYYAYFLSEYELLDATEFGSTLQSKAVKQFRFGFRVEAEAAEAKANKLCDSEEWNAERSSEVSQDCIPNLPRDPAPDANGFTIQMSTDSQEIKVQGANLTSTVNAEELAMDRLDACPESSRYDNCY